MEGKEKWKDVEGYEGQYQVSNLGRIASFHAGRGWTLIATSHSGQYYPTVTLCKRGKKRTFRIHRLVAGAFIANPGNLPEVNHKDMNKANRRADNLEWVTPSQNIGHAIKNKPEMIAGMNYYNRILRSKPICPISPAGYLIKTFLNAGEAGKATGVCSRNISQVANKTEYKLGQIRSQAGGFKWEYAIAGDHYGT